MPRSPKLSLTFRFTHQHLYEPLHSPTYDACLARVILFSSPKQYMVKGADHKVSHYVVFSTPLLPHGS